MKVAHRLHLMAEWIQAITKLRMSDRRENSFLNGEASLEGQAVTINNDNHSSSGTL
jgi:hypothetical protein